MDSIIHIYHMYILICIYTSIKLLEYTADPPPALLLGH